MKMLETYRGSVQTWECDVNGHMNVQFYVAHAADGVTLLGQQLGLVEQQGSGQSLVADELHIRFHGEQRPGDPITVSTGVLGTSSARLRTFQEMRNVNTGELAATFTSVCRIADAQRDQGEDRVLSAEMIERSQHYLVELTREGAPRGIAQSSPRPPPSLAEADQLGMVPTYTGVVRTADTDRGGWLKPSGYMACISAAIPVLVAATPHLRSRDKRIGGAALEYRLVYHTVPRRNDVLTLRSGFKAIQGKTYSWVHWLFDGNSGHCVATAEAVAVSLDLIARRAIALPDDVREALERQQIPDLSV